MLDDSARRALRGTRFDDVRWYGQVASTNSVVADLARAEAREGLVVVADHQTAGRGRMGRTWEEASGSGLLLSVLLRPVHAPARAPMLTLAMALAASEACAEVAGITPLLKWPNDLVAGGDQGDQGDQGKVGGILGETVSSGAGLGVVLGIGLNVKAGHPLPPPGVALEALAGRRVDRSALLVALLHHLDHRYGALDREDGWDALLEDYRARSATLGRAVRVELAGTAVEGEAVDVTPEGHLVVDTNGQRRQVPAGDVVHLRTAGGPGSGIEG